MLERGNYTFQKNNKEKGKFSISKAENKEQAVGAATPKDSRRRSEL